MTLEDQARIDWWRDHAPEEVASPAIGGAVQARTLTDNVYVNLFRTPTLAVGDCYAGNLTYAVALATAAGETQVKSNFAKWVAVRATTGGIQAHILENSYALVNSTGTLVITLNADTSGAGVIFQLKADTSLVPTMFRLAYAVGQLVAPADLIFG